MAGERLIFHIDVNSAFLSWEAARRVRNGEPDLRDIPSAIGGARDKRTGVILAKSIPAKKYGIRTGEPVSEALRKCPDLVLARSDFHLYVENSNAFMDLVRTYAPVVEKYSIDECFADLTGTSRVYPDPIALAYEIKDRIRDELGFTVNVGVADCKILAKMASDFEKPDRVHTLFRSEMEEKMWPLPVGDLFTVGSATARKLEEVRIRTIGDLARSDVAYIQRVVGNKLGQHIWNYANGIDLSPVTAERDEVKGYSNSVTLEEDVTTAEQAHAILLALSESVTARMRRDGVKASCVTVQIRSNRFKDTTHQRTLPEPTDITNEVYDMSRDLFREVWDGKTPLRLLGVALTELTDEETAQLSLFGGQDREKARNLDKATDAINRKFGSATIVRGTDVGSDLRVGKKHKAQMDQKKKE
ncbi:MAG: DNA polymerase IV [Clostridia bacterium]|nr:DNA polymerase IV [Clostridia bacterium]